MYLLKYVQLADWCGYRVTEAQYPTPISNNALGQLVQVSPLLGSLPKVTLTQQKTEKDT